MFFRRPSPRPVSFQERLSSLEQSGIRVERSEGDRVQVARDGCRATLVDGGSGAPRIASSGIVLAGEIAMLVDTGFMKMLATPGGLKRPALADDLRKLQAFREDLREGLGLVSLYNESLGTVCERHDYDRLLGR